MGKSRSTTLIIAFLMHCLPSLTPQAALTTVRVCRPIAEPNPGFMQQLDLYYRMGCPADVLVQPMYQRWLYQREVERSVACGQAPEIIRFGDETDDKDHTAGEVEYRCRKCRRSLATSSYLIEHTPKSSAADADNESGPISAIHNSEKKPKIRCAHLFFDPLSWMRPELEQGKLDGRLECPNPKCKSNIGKYAWQGMQCSCGEWVLPAISLSRSRIDEIGLKTKPPRGAFGGNI